MDPHIIGSVDILLLIACIVAITAEWLKQPYTIALVLVGLIVALTKIAPLIQISHNVIFTIILPPLLFHGAMHVDLEELKNNWRSIALLAVPGVVISTLFIGYALHGLLGVPLTGAMLFGALISPTDPISVLSILKKVGAPKRLRVVLEGESLFNDGTGIVIFTIILSMLGGHEAFGFHAALSKFFIVAGGGTLIGLAVGFAGYHLLKRLDDHLLEVAISVVMTFGTPLLAEHFHFSGMIALVVAGMIIGNHGKHYAMSEKTRETLDTFWEVIEFIINSLLFLMIGIELQVLDHGHLAMLWQPILIAIGVLLASRMIVVYPVFWIKNLFNVEKTPSSWNHILFWGGLKGSLSIALVVSLPTSFEHREVFLILAFSIVLFSLVFQGLTMKPLITKLGLDRA